MILEPGEGEFHNRLLSPAPFEGFVNLVVVAFADQPNLDEVIADGEDDAVLACP